MPPSSSLENFIGQIENNQKTACISLVPDKNRFRIVCLVQHKKNKQVEPPTSRGLDNWPFKNILTQAVVNRVVTVYILICRVQSSYKWILWSTFWQLIKNLSMIPKPQATWFFKVKFSSEIAAQDGCQTPRATVALGNFPKIKYQSLSVSEVPVPCRPRFPLKDDNSCHWNLPAAWLEKPSSVLIIWNKLCPVHQGDQTRVDSLLLISRWVRKWLPLSKGVIKS